MNITGFDDVTTATPEATVAQGVEVRNVLINVLGLGLNTLALAGIVRHKRFSGQFKVHVSSITVADLSLNVCLLILFAGRAMGGISSSLCIAVLSLSIYSIFTNPVLMLVLAVDRFYAVFFPIKYRMQDNASLKAVVRVIIAMATVVPVTFFVFYGGANPSRYCNPFDAVTNGGLLTPGLMLMTCACVTITIYIAMACKMAVIGRRCSWCRQPLSVDEEQTRVTRRTHKLTVQSAVVVGWFCISYVPFGLYAIIHGRAVETSQRASEHDTTRFLVMSMAPFLNAIVDPFIFFWHLGGLKAIGLAIGRCFRGQGSNLDTSANTASATCPRGSQDTHF